MWASRASEEHEINFPHGPAVHPAGRAGGRRIDPIIALGIAAWSVWEGHRSWRGADCR